MALQTESNSGGTDEGLKINPKRLRYALDLYKLNKDYLLSCLVTQRKHPTKEELESILEGKEPATIPLLKKIDKVFNKGLSWYISKRELPERKSSSIFFRKDKFNAELNRESIRFTNSYEGRKFEIQTLCNFIDFKPQRELRQFTLEDLPKDAAKEIAEQLDNKREELKKNRLLKKKGENPERDLLVQYIQLIEGFNVFVLEFIENANKKEKVTFGGFFMRPNMIVIKRESSYRRELFTLIHEFAHYLLDYEEIDETTEESFNQDKTERWCNNFVFNLLAGHYEQAFDSVGYATKGNNYLEKEVQDIYNNTPLSKHAIYTRLRMRNKISQADYDRITGAIRYSSDKERAGRREQMKAERLLLKEQGKKPAPIFRKPIQSNLLRDIVRVNYLQGNIDENRVSDLLGIPYGKVEKVIYQNG